MKSIKNLLTISILFFSLFLNGCGGGGGDPGTGGGGGSGASYRISVVTSGLTSSGLVVGVSSDAGSETMSISSNGSRSFALSLPAGSLYTVGIGTQPTGQSCSLGGNFFSTSMSSDASVTVTCVSTMSIGGTVTGLTGNIRLSLTSPKIANIYADLSANGSFTFSKPIANGEYYAVTVSTQPAGQTCLVTNSSGLLAGNNISDVVVTCSTNVSGYKVGGYISGLSGAVKLDINGIEELSTVTNGSFTFASSIASGSPFTVTVLTAPVGYECSVQNGSGTIASSDYPFVDIDCKTNSTLIKPLVDPDGAYLNSGETITLTLNGTTDLTLDSWDWTPISFSQALNPGDSYSVTIKTPPVGESCVLYNSEGVIKAGVRPLITISCVADSALSYTIGGNISNLTGNGLVLRLDGRDSFSVAAASSSYTFPEAQLSGTGHVITILSQPTGQICSIQNNNPYLSGANITNADIICSNGPHSITGYAVGVTTTGLSLKLNDTETLSIPASGSFSFNTLLSDGMNYEVSIASQPVDHTCSINYATGWNLSASVNNILIECLQTNYSVATNIKGYLSSTPLLLQLNGGEIIEATANTISIWYPYTSNPLAFTTQLKKGASYSVSIAGQPIGQVCTLTNSSGVIGTTNVSDVGVLCVTESSSTGPYSVSVSTTGLIGSGLVLQLNDADDLAVAGDGYASFTGLLADTGAYTVSVLTQPSAPLQVCSVVNGSGTIAAANITNVSVRCDNGVQSRYPTNGRRWLDYVKNDAANNYSATDLACEPGVDTGSYDACLNGGVHRVVSVPALTSCATVTASDDLNVFNWVCDETNGVHLISTGLKTNISLTDLIDFYDAAFKPNFVTVLDNGVYVDATETSVWWDNPVKVNNTGAVINTGEIILVTASVYEKIDMVYKTAVLVQPGSVLGFGVYAVDQNYLWFEGDVGSSTNSVGIFWFGTVFSVAQNIQSLNNVSEGIYIKGSNSQLKNIISNNNSTGVRVSGEGNLLENITANNNSGGYGGIYIIAKDSILNNINTSDNDSYGVLLDTTGNVNMNNVTANGNGTVGQALSGIRVTGNTTTLPGPHIFSNITANNNSRNGIEAEGISNSNFTNINVNNNTLGGLDLDTATKSSLSNIVAHGNGNTEAASINMGSGIYAFRWTKSSMKNLLVANNGLDGIEIEDASDLFIDDVTTNNNARNGYRLLNSPRIISSNIMATNNTGTGISNLWSTDNVMIGVTSANNNQRGIELSAATNSNFSSILSLNNSTDGIYIGSNNIAVDNMVMANNTGYGIKLVSDNGYYTGLLEMGSNGMGNCLVDISSVAPGLWQDGPNNNNLNNNCILEGSSDGTIIQLIDASSSIVGKVTSDDTSTTDDDATPGIALFDNITAWNVFDNSLRAWGIDGALSFADASNQGACNIAGNNCRIWDWSVSVSDAGNSGVAAVNNVVALPLATDVFTFNWTTVDATDQSYCNTTYPGSSWDGTTICTSTYLQHSQEIAGDSIGNDNALCEIGETCLYLPNIGSYQGHGALVVTGTVGTGADTITLMQYANNGR